MDGIVDKITEFIKEMLQGWVLTNLETMFTDVNDKVGTIATEVGKSPSTWNCIGSMEFKYLQHDKNTVR